MARGPSHRQQQARSRLSANRISRIALETLKGGVGKTELVAAMAAEDTRQGLHVLVVELDPQGTFTNRTLGVEAESVPRTVGTVIRDVIAGGDPATEARKAILRMQDPRLPLDETKRHAWGQLDVLVCNQECGGLQLPSEHLRVLDRIVSAVESDYDRIWFDFSPSITVLAQTGRYAAHRFIGVTEAAKGAIRGIWQWRDTLSKIDQHHPADVLDTSRVVINKYAQREVEEQLRARELEDELGLDTHGGLLLSPHIPRRAVVRQAEGAELPIWYYGGSEAREIAERLSRLHTKIVKENKR